MSWLPPALLRWCSIQSGEEGWATCVHWGMARKRQPLHLRGSTCQEQSRCSWCSKCKFSQCYAMTMVDPDFEGVGTWTIGEAFFKKNMNTQLGTGPWGLGFISLPGHPPLVVIMWVSKQAKSAYLRQMWLVFRVSMWKYNLGRSMTWRYSRCQLMYFWGWGSMTQWIHWFYKKWGLLVHEPIWGLEWADSATHSPWPAGHSRGMLEGQMVAGSNCTFWDLSCLHRFH